MPTSGITSGRTPWSFSGTTTFTVSMTRRGQGGPDAQREVVEVAVAAGDAEERGDSLGCILLQTARPAGRAAHDVERARRAERLEHVASEEPDGEGEAGAAAEVEPDAPAHLGARHLLGVEIGAHVEIGPQEESPASPQAIRRGVQRRGHQHRAGPLEVVLVARRQPEPEPDREVRRPRIAQAVLRAQDQVAHAGGLLARRARRLAPARIEVAHDDPRVKVAHEDG